MALTFLLQAEPRDPATAAVVPVAIAGGGAGPYFQLGVDWRAGLVRPPRFRTAIEFGEAGPAGGGMPATTTLRIAPSDQALVTTLAGLLWTRARITVRTGDDEAAAPAYPVALKGTVAAVTTAGNALTLTVSDLSTDLARPVAPDSFAGTGGLEGPIEAAGRVKRRSWGPCFNVEGRILDKANNIFEFGDPARPLNRFVAVKDKGRAATAVAVLGWQGSADATLAALRVAVAPAGGCVACPSIACVKTAAQPVGPLTADLEGEIGAAYVGTAPAIAGRLVASFAPAIATTNLAAALGWQGNAAGLHVESASESVAAGLDRLLLPLFLAWIVTPAGDLVFRRFSWDGPIAAELDAQAVEREAILPPVRSRRLGYQRNHRTHSDAEISAALLDDKLAGIEAGANVTQDHVAAGIVGQGWGATASEASASNARVPIGANSVFSSSFARGIYGWVYANNGGLPATIGLNYPAYFGKRNVGYARYPGATPNAGYGDITPLGQWAGSGTGAMRQYALPVKQGDRVAARSLVAFHRCTAWLYLLVFDKDGGLVHAPWTTAGGQSGGGYLGDNFGAPMQVIFDVTEPTAAYAQLMIRQHATPGEADPFVFWSEAWCGKLAPGQSVIPPYSHGPNDPLSDGTIDNTAGGIVGQAAIATDQDAVARILAMRGDNFIRNSLFEEGLTGYVGQTSLVPFGAVTGMPTTQGIRFEGNNAYASVYANSGSEVPISARKLFLSAVIKSDAITDVNIGARWFNADGTYSYSGGTVTTTTIPTEYRIAVDAPVTAKSAAFYIERFGRPFGTYVSAWRASPTAPGATVGAQAGSNLYRADGVTPMTQAEVRTPEGYSAGFYGQARLATINYADLDGDVVDGATYGRLRQQQLAGGYHRLTIAGSGLRLGDQRNVPLVRTMNVGYVWPSAISYTADYAGNATISVAAATVPLGSIAVGYNAMAVAVTGPPGQSVTFGLYFIEANPYSGGSQSLVATTTGAGLLTDDRQVYVGLCTVYFPVSNADPGGGGTGGGSGGGGGGGWSPGGGRFPVANQN